MTEKEINARFAEINARPAEEPSAEDIKAFELAQDEPTVSLDSVKAELDQYSGPIVLRIPRSLHKQLKEAAAVEGVSLNQYMLYKLAN